MKKARRTHEPFSIRLMPFTEEMIDAMRMRCAEGVEGESTQRELITAAVDREVGGLTKALQDLGFAPRRVMTDDERKKLLERIKINDAAWTKLDEHAKLVGLDRTSLLIVCLTRHLRIGSSGEPNQKHKKTSAKAPRKGLGIGDPPRKVILT